MEGEMERSRRRRRRTCEGEVYSKEVGRVVAKK